MADFCLAEPSALSPKPQNLTHAEAASVPISALTAWQGLFIRAGLKHGERVLVHGGAGSVGSFVIQLAKWRGAHVVATASARNLSFTKELGADEVLDYRKTSFEQSGSFDVVFDTVGNGTLERSWGVLALGGRLETVAASAAESTEQRIKDAFFFVEPNGKQLEEIKALLEARTLRTVVDAVFPLAQAPEVYSERVVRRRRGKLVVSSGNC
jgi:NADPH:quinone reductase-like Zn-dependent oxidoreductase